jgi:hypothetical protein
MLRIVFLVTGLVLLVPAGLYLAWHGVQRVPGVAALGADFAESAEGIGKGLKAFGSGTQVVSIGGNPAQVARDLPDGLDKEWGPVRVAHRQRGRFDSFLRHAALDRNRMLRFVMALRPEEMLAEGEAMPAPEWLDLLAEARAVPMALRACALLPEGFASACNLRDTEVIGRDPATGDYLLSISLNYVEVAPLGQLPSPADDPRIVDEVIGLEGLSLAHGSTGAVLAELLGRAQARCAERRAQHRNCAVERVTLDRTGQARITLAYMLSGAEIALRILEAAAPERGADG